MSGVQGSGLRVRGSGFRVQGSGCLSAVLDHGAEERLLYVHLLLAVPGAGLRVEG